VLMKKGRNLGTCELVNKKRSTNVAKVLSMHTKFCFSCLGCSVICTTARPFNRARIVGTGRAGGIASHSPCQIELVVICDICRYVQMS